MSPLPTFTVQHAIVFVDETGHDRFHDPVHPVFGWAGCAMTASNYRLVASRWRAMKQEFFPSAAVLHAAALHRPEKRQLDALGEFFADAPFSRFGAVARSDASIEFDVLATLAAGTTKRIETILSFMPFTRLALVFEAGTAWNAKVERMFGPLRLYDDGREIPVEKFFLAKDAAEPGLEIADFIAHAVGGAGRTQNTRRKDFRAVFDGPKERSSAMLIQSARHDPARST